MKSLKNGWESWKALSKRIGRFQARVIFSVLYFILVTPIGLLLKRSNYLQLNTKPQWEALSDLPDSIEDMRQQ